MSMSAFLTRLNLRSEVLFSADVEELGDLLFGHFVGVLEHLIDRHYV